MYQERQEYKGHRIELRAAASDKSDVREIKTEAEVEPELLIDDQYFLREYAYDWHDDLMDLARGLIDYRERVDKSRSKPEKLGDRKVKPKD